MKPILSCPGYSATISGRIWSTKTNKFLHRYLSPYGYFLVSLYLDKKITKRVNRLILEAFKGSCPKGLECCHNNGVRTDNRLKNLRWDTRSNNAKDAVKHGTHVNNSGENCGTAKLTKQDVRLIRKLYESKKFNQYQLANKFNVNQSNISYIIRRKRWSFI